MRWQYLDIDKFLELELPHHNRQGVRMKLFRLLLFPLMEDMELFHEWRKFKLKEANVTGQTLSLESWLNEVVPNADGNIRILHYDDGGVWSGLESEVAEFQWAGIDEEPSAYIYVPIEGEGASSFTADFKVLVPGSVDQEYCKGIIERYRLGGTTYELELIQ